MNLDIGIDFGTTNSWASNLVAGGEDRVRSFGPFPSLCLWRNGETFFGDTAKQLLDQESKGFHPIRDLKLKLGGGSRVNVGSTELCPIKLSSEFIKELIESASYSDSEISSITIGIPVSITRKHRLNIVKATKLAGYNNVQLVYEPTAALIGSDKLKTIQDRNLVLVVDWGGGTLDLSLVKTDGARYREIAVSGDVRELGGTCFDEAIAKKLLTDQHPGLEPTLEESKREHFKSEVENIKIRILEDALGEDAESEEFLSDSIEEGFKVEPRMIHELARSFGNKALKEILSFLRKSGISRDSISHILFCGGVSRCGVIKGQILNEFGNTTPIETQTPDSLTGRGCGWLAGKGFDLELAADVVCREADGMYATLIEKGLFVGRNMMRDFDFYLTDVTASAAHFEFGVANSDDTTTSKSYVPLGTASVATCSKTFTGDLVADIIKLHIGVDETLSVAVFLQSHASQNEPTGQREVFLTGLPTAIKLKGIK